MLIKNSFIVMMVFVSLNGCNENTNDEFSPNIVKFNDQYAAIVSQTAVFEYDNFFKDYDIEVKFFADAEKKRALGTLSWSVDQKDLSRAKVGRTGFCISYGNKEYQFFNIKNKVGWSCIAGSSVQISKLSGNLSNGQTIRFATIINEVFEKQGDAVVQSHIDMQAIVNEK